MIVLYSLSFLFFLFIFFPVFYFLFKKVMERNNLQGRNEVLLDKEIECLTTLVEKAETELNILKDSCFKERQELEVLIEIEKKKRRQIFYLEKEAEYNKGLEKELEKTEKIIVEDLEVLFTDPRLLSEIRSFVEKDIIFI